MSILFFLYHAVDFLLTFFFNATATTDIYTLSLHDALPISPCAFPGKNPGQAVSLFLQPIGRSVYNGLQMKLTQNVSEPFRGVKALNFQVAYSLSRFQNSGGIQVNGTAGDNDQDFVLQAPDNNNPNR